MADRPDGIENGYQLLESETLQILLMNAVDKLLENCRQPMCFGDAVVLQPIMA